MGILAIPIIKYEKYAIKMNQFINLTVNFKNLKVLNIKIMSNIIIYLPLLKTQSTDHEF